VHRSKVTGRGRSPLSTTLAGGSATPHDATTMVTQIGCRVTVNGTVREEQIGHWGQRTDVTECGKSA